MFTKSYNQESLHCTVQAAIISLDSV